MFDMHNVTEACLKRELAQPSLTHCLNIAHHANRFNGYDGPEYNPDSLDGPDTNLDCVDAGILMGEDWAMWRDGCLAEDHADDSMDGDHASALASAGFGTDEDYGCYE